MGVHVVMPRGHMPHTDPTGGWQPLVPYNARNVPYNGSTILHKEYVDTLEQEVGGRRNNKYRYCNTQKIS